jgi:hypothetical protein
MRTYRPAGAVGFAALALSFFALTVGVTQALDVIDLGAPARLQWDVRGGYCGEVSLQTHMLRHGAWIPQEVARVSGGGELLLGVNYPRAMRALKISFSTFTGTGYQAFFAWAKQRLVRGEGVVNVAFYSGATDPDYDHIMPVVGIESNSINGTTYDPTDVFRINSLYSLTTSRRIASGYWCTASNKKDTLVNAGCVPVNTLWGHSVLGPVYAGIGPAVKLSVTQTSEPPRPQSVTMNGVVTVSGLKAGTAYVLYRVDRLAAVPASAIAKVATGVPVVARFNATAAASTRSFNVTFPSTLPAYFICV